MIPAQPRTGSVGVIGGGIFGVSAALELSSLGIAVTLYEKRSDILDGATARNMFRLHRGYHYPRDADTASQARDGFRSFWRAFGDAVVGHVSHYYAIASAGSRTTVEQFRTHCDQLGLRVRTIPLPYVAVDQIEECFEVEEYYFDVSRLKRIARERLLASHVRMRLGHSGSSDEVSRAHDYVVVAAYGSINQVLQELGCPRIQLQYEVCEVPIIHAPSLRDCSIVVMDGPFVSIAPYRGGLHLLYDVVHSVHARVIGYRGDGWPAFARHLDGPPMASPLRTRFEPILASGRRFLTPLNDVAHIGSLFAERVVLPGVSESDKRPTLVQWVSPNVISILSGKVSVAVDAGRTVAMAIAARLSLHIDQSTQISLLGPQHPRWTDP